MTMNLKNMNDYSSMRRTCVKVRKHFRDISKTPAVRAGVFLKKHIVRSAALGLVPSAMNEVGIHHAPINFDEFVHIIQDQMSLTILNAFLAGLFVTTKLL